MTNDVSALTANYRQWVKYSRHKYPVLIVEETGADPDYTVAATEESMKYALRKVFIDRYDWGMYEDVGEETLAEIAKNDEAVAGFVLSRSVDYEYEKLTFLHVEII